MVDVPEALETRRFHLRPPMSGDEPGWLEAIEETWDDLHMWIPWARHKPTLASLAEKVLAIRERFADRTDLAYHIRDKASGRIAGGIGLHRLDWDVPRFEIGYWVRKSFHRQGVAAEVTTHMRDVCLNTLGARRVEIRCSHNNLASQRVALAAGFPLEATLRNHMREYYSGELCDTLVYAIVR